jgi:hypothetical protein
MSRADDYDCPAPLRLYADSSAVLYGVALDALLSLAVGDSAIRFVQLLNDI